jgi:carbonic anhydrase/acetyltransferase-like protein (isoleucine patch superfamily)
VSAAGNLVPYGCKTPTIGANVWIAPDAWVTGDINIGDESSVFFGSSLRGDILPIKIGRRSNLQEHSIVHTSNGRVPTIIGDETTIGHRATLHGCTIGNRVLIGMGAIILDEAVIDDEVVIGAGALITEGKKIPSRSLVFGSPGRIVRQLTDEEVKYLKISADRYVEVASNYRRHFQANFP